MIGVLVLAATLAVGSSSGQDKKDTQPDKIKAQMPASWGWAKIGLTADQKGKVYEVISSYSAKIKSLQEQIDKLRVDEYAEAHKFLTDAQKAQVKPANPKLDTG